MSEPNDIPELDEIPLEEVTLDEVKANIPKVFMNPSEEEPDVSFEFVLETLDTVGKVRRQTKVGIADMYRLKSEPPVFCFRNAYLQLVDFVDKNKIKLPATIFYKTRKGSDFDTKYIFEKV